jgi:hypothetical protein
MGACGNVGNGGTRNPPYRPKGYVTETLRLRLRALQFYPDGPRLSSTNPGVAESRRPVSDARHVGGHTCRRPEWHRTSVRIEAGHGKGNRSGGRWGQGVGGLHTSEDVGERSGKPDLAEYRRPVLMRT